MAEEACKVLRDLESQNERQGGQGRIENQQRQTSKLCKRFWRKTAPSKYYCDTSNCTQEEGEYSRHGWNKFIRHGRS